MNGERYKTPEEVETCFRANLYIIQALYEISISTLSQMNRTEVSSWKLEHLYKILHTNSQDFSKLKNKTDRDYYNEIKVCRMPRKMETIIGEYSKYKNFKSVMKGEILIPVRGYDLRKWKKELNGGAEALSSRKISAQLRINEELRELCSNTAKVIINKGNSDLALEGCNSIEEEISIWMFEAITNLYTELYKNPDSRIKKCIELLKEIDFATIDKCSDQSVNELYSGAKTLYNNTLVIYNYRQKRNKRML